jgi:hypothetical protein
VHRDFSRVTFAIFLLSGCRRIALVNWRTAKEAAKAALRAQAVALGDTASGMAASSSLVSRRVFDLAGDTCDLQYALYAAVLPAPFALCGILHCQGVGIECVAVGFCVQTAASPHAADQQRKESLQLKQQLVQQWKQEQAAAREEAARAAQEQLRLQQQQERQQRQQRQEALKRHLQEAKAAKQQQEQELAATASQVCPPVRLHCTTAPIQNRLICRCVSTCPAM